MDTLTLWLVLLIEGMAAVNAAATLLTKSRRATFLFAVNTIPPVAALLLLAGGVPGWRQILVLVLAYLYAFRQGWMAPAWFGTSGGGTTEYGAHTGSASLTQRRLGWLDDALVPVALTNMAGWLLAAPLAGAMARTGPFDGLDTLGIALYLLGTVIQSGSAVQRFRISHDPPVAGQPVTTGFWGLCRHPDCFGDVVVFTGFAVLSGSVWGLLAPLACGLQYWLDAIPVRERAGRTRHGAAWDGYRARVRCLIPYVL